MKTKFTYLVDGYAAALVNFRFLANTTWTTEEAKEKIEMSDGG